MKAKLLALAMVCAGGAVIAQPAAACSIVIEQQLLGLENPRQLGISEEERQGRWAAYRARLVDAPAWHRAEWAIDTERLLGQDMHYQAKVLVDTLLPAVIDSDHNGGMSCGYGYDRPLDGDLLYQRLAQEIREAPSVRPAIPHPQHDGWILVEAVRLDDPLKGGFDADYAQVVRGCGSETRDRVVARLLARLGPDHVSRVVERLGQHGLLEYNGIVEHFRQPLMRFAGGDPTRLELVEQRRPEGLYDSYQDSEAIAFYDRIAAEEWEAARTYLQEDTQALALIAAIEAAMAEMRDEAQTFDGFCPQTVSELRRVVETRLQTKQLASGPWVAELLRN